MLSGALGILASAAAGYLLGALPTGHTIARTLRGVDLRHVGSGHTGGSNVARIAGFPAGLATGVVDALLGAGAAALSGLLSADPWAATAAGAMAVVGHNWSLFIGFGGGIGLAKLGGALLWISPTHGVVAILLLLGLWLGLIKVARVHRARATIIALVLAGPLLWAIGTPLNGILLAVLGAAAAIVKTLPDWNRAYP